LKRGMGSGHRSLVTPEKFLSDYLRDVMFVLIATLDLTPH